MAEIKKYLDLVGAEHIVDKLGEREDSKIADGLQKAKDYADGLADNYDAAGVAETKVQELANGAVKTNTDAISKLNGEDTVEGSVKKQIKTAKDELTAMIEETKTSSKYDDTQIKADIKANAETITSYKNVIDGKLSTLVGSDTDKSVRTIANEELAAQLIPDGAKESLNTLQEIASWIQSHPDDASAINDAIAKLEAILNGIGDAESGEKASVIAYVTDTIAALKIGDYAKVVDLTALIGRVSTLETNVTSEKVLKWDSAEQNAKTYTDNLNETIKGQVTALEERIDEIAAISTEEIDALFD